ncbi:MAG: hypothetical protein WCL18_00460 [bacterium]
MKKPIDTTNSPEKGKVKVPMNPQEEAIIAKELQKTLGEKLKVKKQT